MGPQRVKKPSQQQGTLQVKLVVETTLEHNLHEIRFQDLITTGKKQVIFKSLKLTHPRKGYPTDLKV